MTSYFRRVYNEIPGNLKKNRNPRPVLSDFVSFSIRVHILATRRRAVSTRRSPTALRPAEHSCLLMLWGAVLLLLSGKAGQVAG
jgi:hypothetical protein